MAVYPLFRITFGLFLILLFVFLHGIDVSEKFCICDDASFGKLINWLRKFLLNRIMDAVAWIDVLLRVKSVCCVNSMIK